MQLTLMYAGFCYKDCRSNTFDCNFDNGNETIVIGNSSANGTIVMGYLMDQLKPPYRIGAISMAIHDGQARGLLPGFNFR